MGTLLPGKSGRAPGAKMSLRRISALCAITGMTALGWAFFGAAAIGRGAPPRQERRAGVSNSVGTPNGAANGVATSPRAVTGHDEIERTVSGVQRAAQNAPFDLGRVIEQVHYAFRQEGIAWTGGHTTYEARVEGGALQVTPYHFRPAASQQRAKERARLDSEAELASTKPQCFENAVKGTAVRFGRTLVTRGPAALASEAPEVIRTAQGQLEIVHEGGLLEHLRNGAEGIEQSWEFERIPRGHGDLEVRVPVAAKYLGATEGGLHFTAGTLGVRYGHATWVDAAGVKTRIEARWDGEAIALRVPSRTLEASAYPAVLDPVISPQFGMDSPTYGPADDYQYAPAVVSGGGGYLVAWQDRRASPTSPCGCWQGYDIYGARVSALGVVQDSAGIPISTAAYDQEAPKVAWDGTNYLVVWNDDRGGTSSDIYGARVSAAGVVQDAAGIPISTAANDQYRPQLAWDGTNHLVVWQDSRSGAGKWDIYGARVSASGVVQDTSGIPITTNYYVQYSPAVAWDGTNHLVAWEDYRSGMFPDIYGARVSAAGTVSDPAGIAISTAAYEQRYPALAWDGMNYLVVWTDKRSGLAGTEDVYGARVSAAGIVLDANGIPISAPPYGHQGMPQVAWDGATYLVVWSDSRNATAGDIYGARVSADGTVHEPEGIAITTAAHNQLVPALAWDGANYLVVWEDYRSGASDIYGARVSTAGWVQDTGGILVSTAANRQSAPAAAWDGTRYLVVWQDLRNGNFDIYGARVSTEGAVQDVGGIPISTAPYDQWAPAVVWNGTNYLVAWADHRSETSQDVYGARVSADGAVQDATGIPISTAAYDQWAPAVAWDGTDYFVVWADYRSGTTHDIYGARVSVAGMVQDAAGIPISIAANDQLEPAAEWGGTNFLVVWSDYRSGAEDVYGARVGAAGVVLDAAGIPISTAAYDQSAPALAWDGANFLVAWRDYRGGTDSDIYGARVSAAGTVWDPAGIPISTAAYDQSAPALAWDGTNYLAAWQDLRSAASYDVYVGQLSAAGEVLDPTGILVSGSNYDETAPALALAGPRRRFLVAYTGFDTAPTVQSQRTLARMVTFNTPPVADPQTVTTSRNTAVAVTLTGSDADGDALTYWVLTPPANGTLSGTAPNLNYTPARNYNGPDSFTFAVNDGSADSAPATVEITVTKK